MSCFLNNDCFGHKFSFFLNLAKHLKKKDLYQNIQVTTLCQRHITNMGAYFSSSSNRYSKNDKREGAWDISYTGKGFTYKETVAIQDLYPDYMYWRPLGNDNKHWYTFNGNGIKRISVTGTRKDSKSVSLQQLQEVVPRITAIGSYYSIPTCGDMGSALYYEVLDRWNDFRVRMMYRQLWIDHLIGIITLAIILLLLFLIFLLFNNAIKQQ